MHKSLLVLILALFFVSLCAGQTTDTSDTPLGDVAKKSASDKKGKDSSKNGAAKPNRIFTDDDMKLRKSPLPAITLQGAENSEEILTAIHAFRAGHTVAETEDAVHTWFDEQTEALSTAIQANIRAQQHRQLNMEAAQDRMSYPYNYNRDPADYSKYNEAMTSERWTQRAEARTSQENALVIGRIQQVLNKVRMDVICRPNKIRPAAYDWFKIPTANGIGSY